jgi:hypothetical protein
MGCSQSIIPAGVVSFAFSETTCRSTYGPRQLTSIPTTTRATSFSSTVIEKPLQYSTVCPLVVATVTVTDTESRTIVVTETAPQSDGVPTSTGIVYVSSTAYETVYETQQQTVTAPAVTVAPTPYTVPAPPGFTPIASNPLNAGANTLGREASSKDVLSSTQTDSTTSTMAVARLQAAASPTQETNNAAPDLLLQRNPLPAATDLHIHIRAEKSYSNVNRVICDETTSLITTSTRPFTVRHTTLTSTVTLWTYYVHTTLTEGFASTTTATQDSTAYEETTASVAVTETTTSHITETTTETPTVEASDQPHPTVYAACGPDNIIGGIRNHGIVNISPLPYNRFFLTIQSEQATGP